MPPVPGSISQSRRNDGSSGGRLNSAGSAVQDDADALRQGAASSVSSPCSPLLRSSSHRRLRRRAPVAARSAAASVTALRGSRSSISSGTMPPLLLVQRLPLASSSTMRRLRSSSPTQRCQSAASPRAAGRVPRDRSGLSFCHSDMSAANVGDQRPEHRLALHAVARVRQSRCVRARRSTAPATAEARRLPHEHREPAFSFASARSSTRFEKSFASAPQPARVSLAALRCESAAGCPARRRHLESSVARRRSDHTLLAGVHHYSGLVKEARVGTHHCPMSVPPLRRGRYAAAACTRRTAADGAGIANWGGAISR